VIPAALTRLTLTDFRSYVRAELEMDGRPVVLAGPNGAGKTNLLEAVSLLTAGRGLRGAPMAEIGRRLPGEPRGRAWAVAAEIRLGEETLKVGTGVEAAGAARRTVRLEGETVTPGRLSDLQRQVWLTPAQIACSWRAPPSAEGSSTAWSMPPAPATPPRPAPTKRPSASACAC